ncbi:MAG: hypothetical protein KDK97_18795 [Verrucomicrobiales bacterium]|nr:hypothetical protein [Verrucomicrobiales bacterium]MCP5559938.1 hypothetical protein [Verrucomicrobiaceae bacterium]
MESFGTLWQFGQIAFLERFREGVEQAPDIALFKGGMAGLPPFVEGGLSSLPMDWGFQPPVIWTPG